MGAKQNLSYVPCIREAAISKEDLQGMLEQHFDFVHVMQEITSTFYPSLEPGPKPDAPEFIGARYRFECVRDGTPRQSFVFRADTDFQEKHEVIYRCTDVPKEVREHLHLDHWEWQDPDTGEPVEPPNETEAFP